MSSICQQFQAIEFSAFIVAQLPIRFLLFKVCDLAGKAFADLLLATLPLLGSKPGSFLRFGRLTSRTKSGAPNNQNRPNHQNPENAPSLCFHATLSLKVLDA